MALWYYYYFLVISMAEKSGITKKGDAFIFTCKSKGNLSSTPPVTKISLCLANLTNKPRGTK